MATLDPHQPLSDAFTSAISTQLSAFLDDQTQVLQAISDRLEPLMRLSRQFTMGGKRLRPAFCFWGRVAAAGFPEDPAPLLRAAASLDLLHVSALVHDDVMDASDTRRGVPAAHRQLEAEHAATDGRGDSATVGRAGAILLGDLLLMWSSELLASAGLSTDALAAAAPYVQAMRTEVTCGQFLDVAAQSASYDNTPLTEQLAITSRVLEYKSARYTVMRPTQVGAALGGADATLIDDLGRFGSPLGRAFQLRDDLLGIFGDPAVTGKPAGDDLREGKRTMLIAHALQAASPSGAALLDRYLGDPSLTESEVARARDIITESGATDTVEDAIATHYDEALRALGEAHITTEGRTALIELARRSVDREF